MQGTQEKYNFVFGDSHLLRIESLKTNAAVLYEQLNHIFSDYQYYFIITIISWEETITGAWSTTKKILINVLAIFTKLIGCGWKHFGLFMMTFPNFYFLPSFYWCAFKYSEQKKVDFHRYISTNFFLQFITFFYFSYLIHTCDVVE